ncbi:MAG: tRNA lysidine(34) synthetase TilS [Hyphomicrobiaceae bacterium]
MAAGPIRPEELDRLFAPLVACKAVGLAVSGGPDSTALMHLFVRWQGLSAAPPAIVLTVDHGLRPEAAAEAQAVVASAKRLGLEARVLRWAGDKPATGLQEAAREARYRLLGEAAQAQGLDAIVTAHTEDDQAETLLMRLARGSGLDGLAAMPGVTHLAGVKLVRPLLRVPKARLLGTLSEAGIGYVRDPSNLDPRFERTRLRAAAPVLEGLGLTSAALARTSRRLERARAALDATTDDLAVASVAVDDLGVARLDLASLTAAPEEIAVRLVARIVTTIGGDGDAPSLAKLEALTAWLRSAGDGARTLGRTEVRLGGGRSAQAIFLRESRRSPLPVVPLAGGTAILWDGRFRIALEGGRESVQIKGGVTETSGTGGCGKARQSLPLAVRNGVEVASPLDVPGARAAGLTFEFVGGRTIFRDRARAETQK